MLKILFSVAGVLFIGLGLFGGNVLEGFSGDGKGQSTVKLQSAESVTTSSGDAVVTTAIADSNALTGQTAPEVNLADNTAVQTSTPLTNEALAPVATSAVQQTEASTPVVVEVLADNSGGEGAEPMAPAQAAGDLIAMAEQAKSSSRNEQVELAKAVMTSNKQVPDSVVVDIAAKDTEVEAAISATTGSTSNDPLIVIKDRVNLRDGPSIDHPIVLTLEQGQELMEFKREGKWVHVGAYGTSGKIGWVHERLVGAVAQ